MKWRTLIMLVLIGAVSLGGCKKTAETAEPIDTAQNGDHGTSAPAENMLDIEAGMMRDLRITTTKVEQRAGAEGVSVIGELQADQGHYAEVGAPVTARVVRLAASPGQFVRAGQVLAEAQSVELGRARAEYYGAEAHVELARKALDRKRSLSDRIVPRREVQEAEADLATAQANLRAAASALQALGASPSSRGDASRLPLIAPISGTVLERNTALGQMINPEHVAFRIGDLSTVWLIAHAYERDAVRVTAGTLARITLAAFPGQVFTGRVTQIGRQVDPSSRTIPIRVELANPQQVLRPGMSGNAWLQVSAGVTNSVAVPVAALQRVRDSWVVFIPRGERKFEIRSIGRGRDLEDGVEILNGLQPGETVVVDGAFLLKAEAEKAAGGGEEHEH